jgi:hypothetical protein
VTSTRLALGVHQGRGRPCHDPESARRRARDREARYRARNPDRRREQSRRARHRLLARRPEYFREWRQAHPATERERRTRWRLTRPDLLREQRRRRSRRLTGNGVPLPQSHAHHALFDRAWEILNRLGVRRDDHLVAIHDPRWEDACSEAVLAMLEGRDPEAAARSVLATERRLAILSVRFDDLEWLPAGA